MIRRLRDQVQFQIERFLLGGPHYRLLFLGAVIVLISICAGAVIHQFDPGESETWAHASWWAFLRLTDPGYLGDDEGLLRRSLSTVVTITGYVLFMGALIAVMTQWLNQTIRRLELGLTPVTLRRHIVILGWSEHTPELVAEMTSSVGRMQRFLRQFGARRLVVAILAEEIDHELEVAIRQRLGKQFSRGNIILRSGSMLRADHLHRVDVAHAAAIVISTETGPSDLGEADVDARLMKTLLTIARITEGGYQPIVVASVRDARRVEMVRSAYPAGRSELMATEAIMGRLLAQTLRQPGLSSVVNELLDQSVGNELYIRPEPSLVGTSVRDLAHAYQDAVVLGIVRESEHELVPLLNPDPTETLRVTDRLLLVAVDYNVKRATSVQRPATDTSKPISAETLRGGKPAARRILVLGWSHLVPALLRELSSHSQEQRTITVVSTTAVMQREESLRVAKITPGVLTISHLQADFSLPQECDLLPLSDVEAIVILGSDRLESAEDADARTLAGHHVVRQLLAARKVNPRIVVELRDPVNAGFFDHADTEVLTSGVIMSHLLAQVALRRELGVVYDALFGPSGPEFAFVRADVYGLHSVSLSFAECVDRVSASGAVLIGVRRASDGRTTLNPHRAQSISLQADDALIVLRNDEGATA